MFGFSAIHVIGIVAGLALLYQSYRLVAARKEGIFEFLLWAGFGVGLLVISIGSALETVDLLAALEGGLSALGFARGTDSIFFVSNLLLLFVVFYTYVQLVESRRQLSDLTQELALLRYDLEQRTDDED
ncbi:DUF2304 domain-containing protein [Halapricum hydrolyticum]|uniref:DUF2304 domain-containing protein n=1 Tax=Halapricum hydrolyticum TaxID=2979991 RepID=A0AAE3IA72_9EURY|nr:DUF2304 domain-containing protein [Halapricum hydrolyticum]MCU4717696.1 DUF2304 domain-containing protein [Halapricum hydrolyticum]MCU4726775.1 DUF2304 domain-containing protein [Halapricum hydrolyticum]